MPKIIRNAIRCKKCGEVIESKTAHDFKFCNCGSFYLAESGCAIMLLIIIRKSPRVPRILNRG